MDKIKLFESRFNSLINPYVDSYNLKQPIITISDNNKVEVEPAFLNHLPKGVKERVSILVKEINAS